MTTQQWQPVEGVIELDCLQGPTLTYWDGDNGLCDPQIFVDNTIVALLPRLALCRLVDPQPEPPELRIANALEHIAASLDKLVAERTPSPSIPTSKE